jgi:hypothetical protein
VLDEILKALNALPAKERAEVTGILEKQKATMRFVPLPGPQTDAYLTQADVLLYGGAAGGGKSFLLMGLASQEHTRSIVFRRESSQTDGLAEAGKQIIGDSANFRSAPLPAWTWTDGRSLKLAGIKEPGDWLKHAGRERDLIGFDEAGEFLQEQVSSLMAWNRGPQGQRCRIVLASNPPRSSDGYWLTLWFGPWIDPTHYKPAAPGELRYAVMLGGEPHWVEGPDDVNIEGEMRKPLSFTFIPAKLSDNPYRDTPEYRAKLQSLPEPLRTQLLYGDFGVAKVDDAFQCIPSAWVKAAQERWKPQPPVGVPMCCIGVDVAQGGQDKTTLAIRHDGWYAPIISVPGNQTPDGKVVAGLVITNRRNEAKVIVDVGGGYGGDAYGHLKENSVDVISYMGVKKSTRRTVDRQLGFFNIRSEAYWRLREALDPSQPQGSTIALPPDSELVADLCAPTYDVGSGGIKVEAKADLVKRLGRSTDKGDAVVMAWFDGVRGANIAGGWKNFGANRNPSVVMKKHRT